MSLATTVSWSRLKRGGAEAGYIDSRLTQYNRIISGRANGGGNGDGVKCASNGKITTRQRHRLFLAASSPRVGGSGAGAERVTYTPCALELAAWRSERPISIALALGKMSIFMLDEVFLKKIEQQFNKPNNFVCVYECVSVCVTVQVKHISYARLIKRGSYALGGG